jgi:putative Ca2+/H+ antiporter (TMEM165/GDT1 family)
MLPETPSERGRLEPGSLETKIVQLEARVRMDLKLVLTTFATVFMAELGDKTQLATLTFAGGGSSRWAVFIGSAGALVCSSALAVLAGEAITRVVSPAVLQRVAAFAFIAIGVWMLISLRPRLD